MMTKRWKYLFLAASGAVYSAAFAPLFLLPAIFAISALFITLDRDDTSSIRKSAITAWLFGFTHHISGLYWTSNALLTDAERFGWLIPFAVLLLPAILALYHALIGAAYHYIIRIYGTERPSPATRAVTFCLIYTLTEYIRSVMFTGFPWNISGYAAFSVPLMAQFASIVGVHALGFFVLMLGCIPALLMRKSNGSAIFIALTTIAICIYGYAHLRASPATDGHNLQLVQPNIPQQEKWDKALSYSHLLQHISMSGKTADIIIWPEAAVNYLLQERADVRRRIASSLPQGAVAIIGGVRREGNADGLRIYNSMFVIDSEARIQAIYDKRHLVPFGEYVPLRNLLPATVYKITSGMMDFSQGTGAQLLTIRNDKGTLNILPLICYEVIFSGNVKQRLQDAREHGQDVDAIINITNDGWFGNSSGPHQHLHMARMRAIELGLPLVRVSGSGISAVIDAMGNIKASTKLQTRTPLFAPLSAGKVATIYSKMPSHLTAYISALLLIIISLRPLLLRTK